MKTPGVVFEPGLQRNGMGCFRQFLWLVGLGALQRASPVSSFSLALTYLLWVGMRQTTQPPAAVLCLYSLHAY